MNKKVGKENFSGGYRRGEEDFAKFAPWKLNNNESKSNIIEDKKFVIPILNKIKISNKGFSDNILLGYDWKIILQNS